MLCLGKANMALEMTLWRVDGGALHPIRHGRLDQEQRLETWIERDAGILGMDIAIFGRQVQTPSGGRIDLLALDRDANCVILELKRDRTPREVVAQLLDYASWVCDLGFADLEILAQRHAGKALGKIFFETFGADLPETVNGSHSMVLVASELDDSSQRIIGYLSEKCDLSVNAVFFRFFEQGGVEHLGRAWLRDPEEALERSVSKKRTPWSGYWFVNVGEGSQRNWDDNRRHGYLGAGQGERYSRHLRRLKVGDEVFAYMKGLGYVGYGNVTRAAVPISEFFVGEPPKPILDYPLAARGAADNKDSPELSEWAVGVKWYRALAREEARTFKGIFANQNIVCKLRDMKTVDFLRGEFQVPERIAPEQQ
jgi:hypothetical protein